MSVIGIIVLGLLLVFIVPSITAIFSDMDQVLPAPTLFLLAFSNLLKTYWWLMLIIITALAIGFRNFRKTTKGHYLVDKTILSLPTFGTLTKKLAVARFSRTLGSLLENGVSMLPALEIAKNIAGNILISNTVESAARDVGQGQGLAVALSKTETFQR
jgi:general secretion pathway protein F